MIPIVTRRSFAATAAGLLVPSLGVAQRKDNDPSVTGMANPDLAPLDDLMSTFIRVNKVPGASIAVSRGGKLIYARGFGFADPEKKTPVQPTSLFRIASLSKPITAVAVMQLVEQKKVKLDDKVVALMGLRPVRSRDKPDHRWKDITVRQCLQHAGGWDRDQTFDPIIRPLEVAQAVGKRPPVPPSDVIRYMMARSLDFDPGTRVAYSNLGYLILGRIVAVKSGMSYEDYVRKAVFGRIGVKQPQLGRAMPEKRAKGEVRYFDSKGRTGECLYPPRQGQKVPLPDGAEHFEAFEAHGGWIASAVDLAKFAAAFDDPSKCPLLSDKTITEMWARPEGAAGTETDGKPKSSFFGCGWKVRPIGNGGKLNVWHSGYISGSESFVVRLWNGIDWAVLFNTNDNPNGKSLVELVEDPLHKAVDSIKSWPNTDQFPTYLK